MLVVEEAVPVGGEAVLVAEEAVPVGEELYRSAGSRAGAWMAFRGCRHA